MERFYLEVPSISRKEEAIEFINEFYKENSPINGTGGLQRYLDDYEGWLKKLESDYNRIADEDKVPARTFFLVRSNDNKIIGCINIRLALNEKLRNSSGNIGYCIRPSERGKGYNKINLYLGLEICKEYGLDRVLLDAVDSNIASWKTMEDLGGVKINERYSEEDQETLRFYEIDVNNSLESNFNIYEKFIEHNKKL